MDDSLAENTFRLALHPLDQFRAFKRMVDGGMSNAEVATAYFTTERYVEYRPSLRRQSPRFAVLSDIPKPVQKPLQTAALQRCDSTKSLNERARKDSNL